VKAAARKMDWNALSNEREAFMTLCRRTDNVLLHIVIVPRETPAICGANATWNDGQKGTMQLTLRGTHVLNEVDHF